MSGKSECRVKCELMKIGAYKADIESKKRRIEELELQKSGVGSIVIDDMPKGEGCNLYERVDYILDKIDKIERDIRKDMISMCDLLIYWQGKVNKLEGYERVIISLRYFELLSWRLISKELPYDERQIYRMHASALKNLEKIIREEKRCQ